MAHWTDKYMILRDLSLAQGGVTTDVYTVSANEKPPALEIEEETEEEFYRNGVVECDYKPPDLGLIQQMLNMVKDVDLSSDDEAHDNDTASKQRSPIDPKLIPKRKSPRSVTPKERRPKCDRNVAVLSLKKANLEREQHNSAAPFKLLKPEDFMPEGNKKDVSDTVARKGKDRDKNSPKYYGIPLDATSMFKRKSTVSSEGTSVVNSPDKNTVEAKPNDTFKPSGLAEECYNKYRERSKLKQMAQEDIWARAERQMKEIELKRKLQVEQVKSPSSDILGDKQGRDFVYLQNHRHLSSEDCVVCDVFKIRGYDISVLDS